ncbi:transporter [Desulfonatronum parangueonense]
MKFRKFWSVACLALLFSASTTISDHGLAFGYEIPQPGEDLAYDLAQAAQNPVANVISLPFQNNTNFNFGPLEKTQNILNIQPVIPFSLGQNWNLITRTILPVISQPALFPGDDRTFGLGDTVFTAFLSPASPGRIIWGAGPVLLLPSATDDKLGSEQWGAGPSAVALTIRGPWLFGVLANHIWSFAGDSARDDVNTSLIQPFINYNFPGGWFLTSAPIITANWEADSNQTWTVPVGGGVGRLFFLGRQPVNTSLQAYYNVEKPDFGADWSLRLSVQFLFPR